MRDKIQQTKARDADRFAGHSLFVRVLWERHFLPHLLQAHLHAHYRPRLEVDRLHPLPQSHLRQNQKTGRHFLGQDAHSRCHIFDPVQDCW